MTLSQRSAAASQTKRVKRDFRVTLGLCGSEEMAQNGAIPSVCRHGKNQVLFDAVLGGAKVARRYNFDGVVSWNGSTEVKVVSPNWIYFIFVPRFPVP